MKSPRIQSTSTQIYLVHHQSVVTCDDQTYLTWCQTNRGIIHVHHSNKNKPGFFLYHKKQKHKDTLHLPCISFRGSLLTFPKRNVGSIHHIVQLYRTLKASTSCSAFALVVATFIHQIPLNKMMKPILVLFVLVIRCEDFKKYLQR